MGSPDVIIDGTPTIMLDLKTVKVETKVREIGTRYERGEICFGQIYFLSKFMAMQPKGILMANRLHRLKKTHTK
jgi:hypothetical protein